MNIASSIKSIRFLRSEKYKGWYKYLLGSALLFLAVFVQAQTKTTVSGTVTDSVTHQPIPFVNISFVGLNTGGTTDTSGRFFIQTNNPVAQILVACVGYRSKTMKVTPDKAQVINVRLGPLAHLLQVTIIKPRKTKYRNKGNPAVELMRKVIDRKQENRSANYDYFQCKKYTKVIFGVSNVPDKMLNRRSLRKVKFVFQNMDTTKMVGQRILPLYVNEILTNYYTRKSPRAEKEVVYANKKTRFADFIDDVGLMHFVNYMYQDVDVYDENISLFTNKFMSPVAVLAPSFYHYYIIDTLKIEGINCVRLEFFPRNKKDLLFQGYLYVALDSSYALKKIDMTVNKDINLNWVKKLRVAEDYAKQKDNRWMITSDDIYADFKIGKNAVTGMYGEKSITYSNPIVNQSIPDNFYAGDKYILLEDSIERGNNYWKTNRPKELEPSESTAYHNIDSLKQVPAYIRDMDIAEILGTGYQGLGPVELGNFYSIYSHNGVEGPRVKLGMQTSKSFSKKVQFSGYGAYGFTDNLYKYGGGASYSFTKYSIYHFPVKSLTFNYNFDTHVPGENIAYLAPDNVLFSIKRGLDNKIFYEKNLNADFLDEFENHFSFDIGYANRIIMPGGALAFQQYSSNEQYIQSLSQIETSEFSLTLRYAPNEKTYQKKAVRIPVTNFPTYTLIYTEGIKDITGGQYDYKSVIATASGRINLAPLGFSDFLLEGGWLFGTVPYPLLFIQRANQTYLYDEHSYTLMNFLEFASDKYAALSIDHSFYGFFFNRIPLLRLLNWREGLTFKVIYGALGSSNNPETNLHTMLFPTNSNGVPLTYSLNNNPYVEGSVAITNIFKLLRVDIVRRFTHLDNPNVSAWGLRAKIKIDF